MLINNAGVLKTPDPITQDGLDKRFAVNPGSLLVTNMLREGFGIPGNNIQIGADILVRAALSDEFELASGKYFDNDAGKFAEPHIDVLNQQKSQKLVLAMETVLANST